MSALPVCLMLAPPTQPGLPATTELAEHPPACPSAVHHWSAPVTALTSPCALPAGHSDLACATPVVSRVCEPRAVVLLPVVDRPGTGLSHRGGQHRVDHVSPSAGREPPQAVPEGFLGESCFR